MSRLFGMDFFSALTRGSMFRVESVMLRITKPMNFICISPTKQQVTKQAAMECTPLVLEPQSQFYQDPVVVLDFQSLYPSMMIAYNLCYSTYLGKISRSSACLEESLGVVSSSSLSSEVLCEVEKEVFIAPNGTIFAPKSKREGVLPRMLLDILRTRIMIKKVMKGASLSGDKVLYRILDARQYALKMIANVTYGYTAASFSGRMPFAQLADSVVQSGRSTLEKAIQITEEEQMEWSGKVVYGDTDSLFVLLKGVTKERAFAIGKLIAKKVKSINPSPVELKLEKVYLGSVLLTKKRYVGYKIETPTSEVCSFDAKGIEVVRRDSCGCVVKLMEKCLRLLFRNRNLSEIRRYLEKQWTKLLKDQVSIKDLIFAKEVRLGTYSSEQSYPPGAVVSTKAMAYDRRAEPRYGERVPYIVICGKPGARLIDLVISPKEYLEKPGAFRPNAMYYITKQIIPSLSRIFNLVQADLSQWFSQLPRPKVTNWSTTNSSNIKSKKFPLIRTLDRYYSTTFCLLCGNPGNRTETSKGKDFENEVFCNQCSQDKQLLSFLWLSKGHQLDKDLKQIYELCSSCCAFKDKKILCQALDCRIYYKRIQYINRKEQFKQISLFPYEK